MANSLTLILVKKMGKLLSTNIPRGEGVQLVHDLVVLCPRLFYQNQDDTATRNLGCALVVFVAFQTVLIVASCCDCDNDTRKITAVLYCVCESASNRE